MREAALVDAYDLVIFDLDGVVYLVDQPIPGAVEAITGLHERATPIKYATNNASRRAAEVADLLTGLGVPAQPGEVLTTAATAARELARRHTAGSAVLVVGAEALRAEVRDVGLVPVAAAEPAPSAVVQGYAATVGWADLAEACLAVRAGADWVATNLDLTLPSPRGPLPGNGALVAAVRAAAGRDPDLVVGKPAPGLFSAARRQAGAARPLVVGDRLDTDIEGAVRAGMDSLLVLTGVTGPGLLLAAPAHQRPTHVAADLSGLFMMDGRTRIAGASGEPGGWSVRPRPDGLELSGHGSALDALRVLCDVAWSADLDWSADLVGAAEAAGRVPVVTGASPRAVEVLRHLGLASPSLPELA